jgi:hypothetical protein
MTAPCPGLNQPYVSTLEFISGDREGSKWEKIVPTIWILVLAIEFSDGRACVHAYMRTNSSWAVLCIADG